MKKQIALLLLLASCLAWAQKSEKIKGSKNVTIATLKTDDFTEIEVSDNIEIYLEKGDKNEVKIEADDNLHEAMVIDVSAGNLMISTSKTIVSFKKLIVRVTYTDELKTITVKENASLNAIEEIQLNALTIQSFDDAKLYLNVNSKDFTLQSDNDSKIELNLKSEKASIQLSKNATLKALITSADFKCDLYQKAKATLEGDVSNNGIIRLDNNAVLTANKLILKNAQLTTESYSNCSINIIGNLIIDAAGNSEIRLYGDQKIEIKRFVDNVILTKKPTK